MAFDIIFDSDCRPLLLDTKIINQPDASTVQEERILLRKIINDTFKVLNLYPDPKRKRL